MAQTGLSDTACQPSCATCPGGWTPTEWNAERLDGLLGWALESPFAEVKSNPWLMPVPEVTPGNCYVRILDGAARRYRLDTLEAPDADARLTHYGACGVCSTLQDLRVYAANPDLGAPVRQCGLDTLGKGFEANVTCLLALGFTTPCAQVWAWNTANTRQHCLEPCLRLGDAPYHLADGGLNACLACDERESGPVFKAVAGRTRRNTGIPSAMCRPCAEARPVAHDYAVP